MNQSFPCRYGPIYHGTIFFYFLEKYLKKFLVLPELPSSEKNSSDHHNSYNKGPNLAFFSFTESPSNSLLTIKFPKNNITSSNHRNLPKTSKAIFGHQRALGVNEFNLLIDWKLRDLSWKEPLQINKVNLKESILSLNLRPFQSIFVTKINKVITTHLKST
jgi:hypothetical protein